jgi:hypothetical protein
MVRSRSCTNLAAVCNAQAGSSALQVEPEPRNFLEPPMRKPLAVAALAAALAFLGAPPAVASTVAPEATAAPAEQPADPEPVDTPVVVPVETQAPDPEPGDTPEPVVTPDPVTPDPDPVTPDPVVTDQPAPVTPAPTTDPAAPTTDPVVDPTGTTAPAPTDTAAPTTDPTAPVTAGPITNIDVDVDLDDHSDHSVHIQNNTTFYVEGDRYSSVYVWRDVDGRSYRAWDLDCSDFDSQADAQRVLNSAVGDPYWLDADNDGVACEVDSGEFTLDTASKLGVRRGGQISVIPSGSVDTGRAA